MASITVPTARRPGAPSTCLVDELEATAARIAELGGRHLEDHEIGGFTWKIMADPEGNEFCIAPAHSH
jgi:predicted enzyme related to lactoylglutathione lyase